MPLLSYENLISPNCDIFDYAECHVAYWMWRIVPPFLLLFGTFGNVLNIVILSRKALRKFSTSMYLLFLAGSDMTNLVVSLLADAATAFKLFNIIHLNDTSCKIIEWILYTSGLLSVWLLVMITIERLLAIKYPFTAKQKMTPKFAFIACISLFTISGFFTGHLLVGNRIVQFETLQQKSNNASVIVTEVFCTQVPESHRQFYNDYWSLMIFTFVGIIPVIIIVTGNVIIAVTVIKVRQTVLPNIQQRIVAQNIHKTPTKLLFALTAMFLCTTLPFSIYLINLDYTQEVDGHNLSKYQLITVCAYCSVWCNYSFNFLLYFMNGRLFKKEWQKIVASTSKRIQEVTRCKSTPDVLPNVESLSTATRKLSRITSHERRVY